MKEEKRLTVKDLPLDDRPREKLLLRGAQNLSDTELIAILLRTGKKGKSVLEIAREIIKDDGNLAMLATRTVDSLKKVDGIGGGFSSWTYTVNSIRVKIGASKCALHDGDIVNWTYS